MAFHCGNQDFIPNLTPGIWDNFEVHSQGIFTLHFLSLYNIVLANCHGCTNFFLLSMQMNLSGNVFAKVLGNLFIPLISKKPNDVPMSNKKVNEYIVGVFDFAYIFLATNGVVLLFHPNELRVWRRSSLIQRVMAFKNWWSGLW